MKRVLSLMILLVVASWAAAQTPSPTPAPQRAAPPQAPRTNLKGGQAAPDFTLPGTDGKTYKLSDFKGKKNVVLAFYVLAFTGG